MLAHFFFYAVNINHKITGCSGFLLIWPSKNISCMSAKDIFIINVFSPGLSQTKPFSLDGSVGPAWKDGTISPKESPFSQALKSNFRVRAKEPSCPNEKALDEERRPFSREAELTVANKRHDRDEIGSPESIPGRGGRGWRDERGVKAWQRLAESGARRQMRPWKRKRNSCGYGCRFRASRVGQRWQSKRRKRRYYIYREREDWSLNPPSVSFIVLS